jgi:hypothetical protein
MLLNSVVDFGVLPSALLLLMRAPLAAAAGGRRALLGCCCWKHESSCTRVTPRAGFLQGGAANKQQQLKSNTAKQGT